MGDRKRVNVDGDRLSSLPDDLIHKILSFVSIKHAVRTSVLSRKWRYIWTSMPYLCFSSKDFLTLPKFSNFVKHVLSGRNNQIEVSSVKLRFRGKVSQAFVKRILNYSFSHNVQQLNFTYLGEKKTESTEIPLSLFSSQSLQHLTLTGYGYGYGYGAHFITIPTWEMQALVTLNLNYASLHDDNTDKGGRLFSHCANLKNLTITHCGLGGLNGFNIFHLGLSSLTLENGYHGVNVVTPQLKNLIVKNWQGVHLISAPNLSSLCYKDYYDRFYRSHAHDPLQLSTDLLHLEKVDVCINIHPRFPPSPIVEGSNKDEAYTYKIVSLLQQLHNVKLLTLNLELVKFLSSSVEPISHQPSPFSNLQSLKIYPAYLEGPKVAMSSEVKSYLLDGSPDATFTVVSHEEVRAIMDVASARNLMGESYVLLDRWKENSERNEARTKQDEAPMESDVATVLKQDEVENHRAQPDTIMDCHFLERMTHIESYWEDLNKRLEIGYKNTRHVISVLGRIKEVLKKVPSSDRAKLEARFSRLHTEAETIMEDMIGRMKIQCDKKPSFFHDLATSSQRCS